MGRFTTSDQKCWLDFLANLETIKNNLILLLKRLTQSRALQLATLEPVGWPNSQTVLRIIWKKTIRPIPLLCYSDYAPWPDSFRNNGKKVVFKLVFIILLRQSFVSFKGTHSCRRCQVKTEINLMKYNSGFRALLSLKKPFSKNSM